MDDTDVDREEGATGPSAPSTALDRLVDPVVAVADGEVTYLNAAAAEAFDVPPGAGGRPAESVIGSTWNRIESEIESIAVGTVRTIALQDERFDARVHRDVDGITITFDRDEPAASRDGSLKARAIDEAPVGVTISDPDREDNPLIYVNDAFQRMTGYAFDEVVGRNCRFLQGEESDPEAVAEMREAIADDRPVTVDLRNYRKDGSAFWNEVTIAPVRNENGEVTNYVGFQNDVTARKRAQLEAERHRTDLEAERAELERVLERVEGLVQDVTSAVAGATSRSDLEEAVCERIAAETAYETAWIGERSPATGEVVPRTTADASSGGLSVADDHPAAVALEVGEIETDGDGGTTVAIPLSHKGVEYGVLTVRTADGYGIDDRDEVILSALARAVASGINARETSRMLATDAVVAVELELVDRDVAPVALSAAAECELEYDRSVHRTDDETTSLFTATGASMDELATTAEELEGIELRPIVERERECLIELTAEESVVDWLTDRGAVARTIRAGDGRARLTFETPRSTDVRAIVESLEERYPGTDVVSFRQRERNDETRQEFAVRLEEELTERQFVALQRAYLGGYFEWPRPTTGEELAQSMGVARPTFHEHLRTAEAKLCAAFFGDHAGDETDVTGL